MEVDNMAVKFIPRLTAPAKDNKFFINYSRGGYNTAIIMDSTGSVLPNCVGYAQGRYREICNDTKIWSAVGNNLAGNAETFFECAKKAGLPTGQSPKLGAIIVWEGKGSAAGHVAIVEEIKSNGDIVTSNSAWNGTRFYTQTLTKASGYLYTTDGSRPLLGFIYQTINFEIPASTPTPSNIMAGKAVTLNNTKCYNSEFTKDSYGTKSGIYFLWDNIVKNGRIRITNAASRVGVPGQVSCWINIADVGLSTTPAPTQPTTQAIKAGTPFTLKDVPVYSSESGASIGKRSGIYRTWDSTIRNGRIRMTNSASRVGVPGQVSFWVDVANLK